MAGVHPARADFGQMLDQAAIDEIKQRYLLSALIGRRVTLKRAGRKMVGCCPFHNEKTPSFFVDDILGFAHCFGCGWHGDIVRYVMDAEGLRFIDALRSIADGDLPVVDEADRRRAVEQDTAVRLAKIADAKDIWARRSPAARSPAEVYIREARGIRHLELPDTIGFIRTWAWKDYETGEVGEDLPAMICALQDLNGDVVGLQRIFLRDGGRAKARMRNPKRSLGAIGGSAFRLGPPRAEITLVEGPEDALTLAQELPGRSVWCACGTGNLHQIDLPDEVQSVLLAGDNNDAGRLAVAKAAEAYAKAGRTAGAVYPEAGFKDWNDQLLGVRR